VVRDEEWLIRSVQQIAADGSTVNMIGTAELVRDQEAAIVASPAAVTGPSPAEYRLDLAAQEELDLLDESIWPLVEAVARGGTAAPVAGYEIGDVGRAQPWVAEAAWPELQVAVLGADTTHHACVADRHWTARNPAVRTEADLMATLTRQG
jgi:hypothetical protein